MMNPIATVAAWILFVLAALLLLAGIATGYFYVAALALLTAALLAMVALWKPGSNPDRVVILRKRA